MKNSKCIILAIFLLFLGCGNPAWADSQTATATVIVTIPPKIEISLPGNECLYFAQWMDKNKAEENLNVLEEENDGVTTYTIIEKI